LKWLLCLVAQIMTDYVTLSHDIKKKNFDFELSTFFHSKSPAISQFTSHPFENSSHHRTAHSIDTHEPNAFTTQSLNSKIGLIRKLLSYILSFLTTYSMFPRSVLFKGGRQWNRRHYGHRVPLLRLWTNVDRICGERFEDRLEAGWAAVVWSHGHSGRLTMRQDRVPRSQKGQQPSLGVNDLYKKIKNKSDITLCVVRARGLEIYKGRAGSRYSLRLCNKLCLFIFIFFYSYNSLLCFNRAFINRI